MDGRERHHVWGAGGRQPRLVGRQSELRIAQALLLRPDVRLLNLRGPGGIGKTRLALELARLLAPHFEQVYFVELAPIRDTALLLPTIATAVRAPQNIPPLQGIIETLGTMRALLILDNLEHLLPGLQALVTLLVNTENLTVLSTSRAVLHLRDEHELALGPLTLPHGIAGESEAVTFFVQQARTVDPNFEVTSDNRTQVEHVCTLLDGIPLAIELAAARLRALPLAALVEWLAEPLEVLGDGPRDVPERARSLRDAVRWSADLLSEAERDVFIACGVFVGGFTRAAFETVTGQQDGRSVLLHLVEHSLLRPVAHLEARWSMLEPVREFAEEQLHSHPDAERVRERHAHFYLSLVGQARQSIQTLESEWMARFKDEHGNLHAALRWFIHRDRFEDAVSLCQGLFNYWRGRGLNNFALEWITQVLAMPGAKAAPAMQALILRQAGMHAVRVTTRLDDAERYFQESFNLYAALGDEEGEAFALDGMAAVLGTRGDTEGARRLHLDLAVRFEAYGRLDWLHATWFNLGSGYINEGDAAHGSEFLDKARDLAERRGDVFALAWDSAWRAVLYQRQDRPQAALDECRRAWQLGAGMEDAMFDWACLWLLSTLARVFGQPLFAARLTGARDAVLATTQFPPSPENKARFVAEEQLLRAALGEGVFEREWQAGSQLPLPELRTEIDRWLNLPLERNSPATPPAQGGLTSRERDVVALVAAGMSDKRVAQVLGISMGTVSKHVGHVLEKLELRNRVELARWAIEHGISPPTS
ncbi:LuxR C-terminal-related transcriptional regulator [Deinococcus deserti]|uniref:Putative transcriptional regulator, LuxR family n=1 Tax=Deinococcus deserti (strain DSM 17065 / CIP 109153 / LMG 22923 / VCD115) TaxID=546414 RepID=C1D3W2_DEIDV|nr:LuxR C-terminal-related transcriptional regulator [Deinococcus deserti]ACO48191.1 putative transcriptional regulator, LuxR family [Deinococcus deserti VCD115]